MANTWCVRLYFNYCSIDIPEQVDNYCHLVPLEVTGRNTPSRKLGSPSTVYKAINQRDGLTYCLHRIHGRHGYQYTR